MNIQDLPSHITLEYIASRCRECPVCGKQTEWVSRDQVRPPTIDIMINGRKHKVFVRRLVWRLVHPTAAMPNGKTMVVSSKCTNKRCVDPEAVYATTKSKTFQQHAARGTWGGPKASAAGIQGAKKRVKVPDDAVTEIITSDTSTKEAAEKWGISGAYVRMLRTGRSRRYITAPVNPFMGLSGLLR